MVHIWLFGFYFYFYDYDYNHWYQWFFGSDAVDADMFDIDDAEKVMQMISKVL